MGTVQFGLPYGVANQTGQVARKEAAAILERAWEAGLDTLDTAIAYGDSEARLGELGVRRWRVVSKLPALPEGSRDVDRWVRASVRGSLERLRIERLYGLLLHYPADLLGPGGSELYAALTGLKVEGLVEQIGVSIYGPEELDALWPHFALDLVQAPFNVIDRRLATSGWLEKLRQARVIVHVRSVFLQGLLLLGRAARPAVFDRWSSLWERWDEWLAEKGATPLEACLGFALARPEITRIIVGVDSFTQLQGILGSLRIPGQSPPADLETDEPDLVNPSRWGSL